MIMAPTVPAGLALGPGWNAVHTSRGRAAADLRVSRDGVTVDVRLERCAAGRLRDTYPVGAHDVEVRVGAGCPQAVRTELLRTLTDAVLAADPRCRRVVHAVRVGDADGLASARSAGFRHAVDVDLGREELGLLVKEPDWVTATDMDLDRVPGA
ncbi:hypothetical protein [Streptomyces brasiliensis]|uniref:Uncharacterized protein n=1 Tax=Streptomyces brasiliensis TaxID=1954 RepID=A0A917NVR2_9ACTN|nr:hypothetical protein [Streptomyces brasiliensis]GGJ34165.1 hypothetical protein GCM10010121_051730 [Streptomyces brasiliensis]